MSSKFDQISEKIEPPKERAHPRDPLHGVTLEMIVKQLVDRYGWAEMGRRIPIRCFLQAPSVKSSLTFLRKTPWARVKVENWFLMDRVADLPDFESATDRDTPSPLKDESPLTGSDSAVPLPAMPENSSVSQPGLSHVVGEGYAYGAIRKHLGGEFAAPHFVIHRDGAILGLCLGLMWNPLAESDPSEVWVGKKGDLAKWGLKLSETKGPLPVYVRREEGGQWFFIGRHEVTGSSAEPDALKQRLKPPSITAISRVVFLKRANLIPA